MCRGRLPPPPRGEDEDEDGEEGRPLRPDRRVPRMVAAAALLGDAAELERTMGRLAETYAELVVLRAQLAEATALLERSRAQLAELGRRLAEERAFKERLLAVKAAALSSSSSSAAPGEAPHRPLGGRPDEASPAN